MKQILIKVDAYLKLKNTGITFDGITLPDAEEGKDVTVEVPEDKVEEFKALLKENDIDFEELPDEVKENVAATDENPEAENQEEKTDEPADKDPEEKTE